MRVSVDVYTKDLDSALKAFKSAIENGGSDVRLQSVDDYETKALECLNLMFEADHTCPTIGELDAGPFDRDSSNL